MSKRGWILFSAMAVIWGVPYFFIRVAVKELEPPVVVFGRTSIAAVVLLALAKRANVIKPVFRHWKPVLAFAIIEMAIPWILLTTAEEHLASGITALIIAAVPIVGAIAAFLLGERSALRPVRIVGIVLGLGGVGLLVGRDLSSDTAPPWWSVAEVLLVCVCYATAPFIADRKLAGVSSLGVIAVSLTGVAILYAPIAWFSRPTEMPRMTAVWSVVALSVICTGLAFVVFFRLIAEVGADASRVDHLRQPGRGHRPRRGVPRRADHDRHRWRLRARHRRLLAGHETAVADRVKRGWIRRRHHAWSRRSARSRRRGRAGPLNRATWTARPARR